MCQIYREKYLKESSYVDRENKVIYCMINDLIIFHFETEKLAFTWFVFLALIWVNLAIYSQPLV